MKKCFSIVISDYEISDIALPNTVSSYLEYFDEYTIWDKHMIKDFLKNNFDINILNAYNVLNGNAYKADLASYCILNKLGGWYSAITNEIVQSPPDTGDKDMVIFRDIQKNSNTSWAVACQLIYSKPNNKVLDIAINSILENINNKHYGNTSLCITGPCVLGRSIAIAGDEVNYMIGDFVERDSKAFYLDDKKFVNYKKYEGGVTNISGTNNYNDFWNNKNVYKEKE